MSNERSSADYLARKNNINKTLKFRRIKERIFKSLAIISAFLSLLALVLILLSIISKGYKAFMATKVQITVEISKDEAEEKLKEAIYREFGAKTRSERKLAREMFSPFSYQAIEDLATSDPATIGTEVAIWLLASDLVDSWFKGEFDEYFNQVSLPSDDSSNLEATDQLDKQEQALLTPIDSKQVDFLTRLSDKSLINKFFALNFFKNTDSRYPELAGLFGAAIGSLYTILIAILLAFPIGVGSAVYLEEFARKSRWNTFIEVNINNLAAVPSIIFGLLGLSFLLNFLELPRSASLVGGLVLAMMTMPVIVIAARASLKSVPPSIREASLALGASKSQTVFHHVIPYSLPGIMTGTIIGVARALGETAPLLLIGMVAFITEVPKTIIEPATVLPVQIFIWADSPERAFVAKTSAAILVLLLFLILLNLTAQVIRKKTSKKW